VSAVTSIITNSRERTRFLRFAVVGVIGAIVDFGVMNLMSSVFHAPLVVAGTISFIAAILSNFTWNRYWTYPDSRTRPFLRQLSMFTIVSVTGLAIRIPLLAVLEPVLLRLVGSLPIELTVQAVELISDNLTLVVAVIVVMFWNFFVNRYWTYNDVQ
jgi:putative flippase GtrA